MAAAAAELRQPVHDWYVESVEAFYALFSGELDDAERRIARARELELPIAERVCAVLEGESPRDATARLLARPLAAEQRS